MKIRLRKIGFFHSFLHRGMPDATLSTKCIRVNNPKINGLRVMLLCPKSLATIGKSPGIRNLYPVIKHFYCNGCSLFVIITM